MSEQINIETDIPTTIEEAKELFLQLLKEQERPVIDIVNNLFDKYIQRGDSVLDSYAQTVMSYSKAWDNKKEETENQWLNQLKMYISENTSYPAL